MLELHTKTYGEQDGPAIVLLHGLFGSSTNWGTVVRHLAQNYCVLVPDLRNHGQSPHDPYCSYQAMTDDVLGLLDAQRRDSAIFVGHSMGGKVAMHLALNNPDRVDGLVVVDMAPVRYAHNFAAVLSGFRAVELAGIRNRTDADRQMAARVPGAGVRAFLLKLLANDVDRLQDAGKALYDGELMGHPFRSVAKTFQVRVWRELCSQWRGLDEAARGELEHILPDAQLLQGSDEARGLTSWSGGR